MSIIKVEQIDAEYLELKQEPLDVYPYDDPLPDPPVPRRRGRPRKKRQEPRRMASGAGGGGAGQGGTDGAGVVVAQSQILQGDGVLNSPGNSCDEAGGAGGGNPGGGGLQATADEGSPETASYITVAGGSDAGSDDVGHSYVQYVDSTGEQTIYTTSNGQIYPVYTVGGGDSGTMYTSTSGGQYYSPGSTTPVTYAQGTVVVGQDQVAYLVNPANGSGGAGAGPGGGGGAGGGAGGVSTAGQQGPSSQQATMVVDPDGQPNIVHATRVSPTTVQWLLENYETAEGVSLPRCTLYNHYLRHCYENKLDPVNAASFGKLIRSVFLGLKTRRLGNRGNSKYHYYGIRVKSGSVLNQMMGSEDGGGGAAGGVGWGAAGISGGGGRGGGTSAKGRGLSATSSSRGGTSSGNFKQEMSEASPHTSLMHNKEYLGDGSGAIPELPEVELPTGCHLPEACCLEDIDTFRSIYREHCEAFLDAIVNLEFATVESLWREFWRSEEDGGGVAGEECEEEKYFSKAKLLSLCKFRPVQEFVKKVDFQFYQNLVQVLIPDVLRPIPSSLTQAIRNFAKGLESWLNSAMQGMPQDMVEIKVGAVGALSQTLRRYTSLNHLAQAARAVLQNSVQINQMLTDLNRVDFHNVQEQASWVCECDGSLVARLEADFKTTLQQHNSLEQWASWLKAVVNTVLKPYIGRPNFTTAARQLLLKWSFYSSMVIRDLTLRSAASFGSFHLIRLLYDEYMFYLIEHQVAMATGETPIAVMGEKSSGRGTVLDLEDLDDRGGVATSSSDHRHHHQHHQLMMNGGGASSSSSSEDNNGGHHVVHHHHHHVTAAKRLKMS